MDRHFVLFSTAALTLCLFVGCGGGETTTADPAASDAAASSPPPSSPVAPNQTAPATVSEGLTLPDDVPINTDPAPTKNDKTKGMQLPDDLSPSAALSTPAQRFVQRLQ